MNCYCRDIYGSEPWKVFFVDFKDEQYGVPDDKLDLTNYCLSGLTSIFFWHFVRFMQPGFVVFYNLMASRLSNAVARYQQLHFQLSQRQSEFNQLVFSELVLLGALLLVISLANLTNLLKAFAPESEDWTEFKGFNAEWYHAIGVTITRTMLLNCFVTNIIEMWPAIKAAYYRMKDRKWSSNLKMNPDDDFDDEPNTLQDT